MTKRCEYCGRYFSPDKRVGERQKACARSDCKRQRKLQAQKQWKQSHPEVVSRHYEDYVKPWRESHRTERRSRRRSEVIRDEIPPLQGCLELVLRLPVDTGDMIKDEIRLRRVDSTTFAAYGP